MGTTAETLIKIGEALQSSANSRVVYGEPVRLEGKVVVPVSKIAFGFGAGGIDNLGKPLAGPDQRALNGSGGGGGMRAYPVGALEISPQKTRFIPASGQRSWLIGLATGALLGSLVASRCKKTR